MEKGKTKKVKKGGTGVHTSSYTGANNMKAKQEKNNSNPKGINNIKNNNEGKPINSSNIISQDEIKNKQHPNQNEDNVNQNIESTALDNPESQNKINGDYNSENLNHQENKHQSDYQSNTGSSQTKGYSGSTGYSDFSGYGGYSGSSYYSSSYGYYPNYNYGYKEKIKGIFGFKNSKLTNNCFMNSSLQNLLHCDKFVNLLHSIKDSDLVYKPLAREFKKLIDQVYNEEIELDATKLKGELAKVEDKYNYNDQNDANEFITIFLNQLLIELKGIGEYKINIFPKEPLEVDSFNKLENRFFEKNKSFLLNLFYGRLKREYICENGHLFNVKFTNYNTLILPQPGNSNKIIDLLNLYQAKKPINDIIFCNKCNANSKYYIKTSIFDIPKYFILCLEKESVYSSHGLYYTQEIFTREFMKNYDAVYTLNSLIVYSGNRKFGHYVAKCSQDNSWYYISDSYYTRINNDEFYDKNAIILFYKKGSSIK